MREYFGVPIVLVAIYLLTALNVISGAFGRGRDDSVCEARWRSLDPLAQARIAKAADSRSATEALEPEERELVPGYLRYRRRRRAQVELLPAAIIAALGTFALAGVIGNGPVIYAGGIFAMAVAVRESLYRRRTQRALRTAVEAEAT